MHIEKNNLIKRLEVHAEFLLFYLIWEHGHGLTFFLLLSTIVIN
jgi:hypothetical protein